jgi:hypothetical protein
MYKDQQRAQQAASQPARPEPLSVIANPVVMNRGALLVRRGI